MHGQFLKETLNKVGINSSGLTLSNEYFTTLAFVDVKDNGEREFSFARNHGADKMLEIDDIPTELIANSRILHIGSISLTDDPCRSATMFAVENAKKSGCIISYDPNYRASLWKIEDLVKKQMREMIRLVDVMKISDEETALLTDCEDHERAAEHLIAKGVKIAVVTLGKTGAYVRTQNGGEIVKGFRNKALDATGAGDAFWGGFLYCLARSGKSPTEVSLSEAVRFTDFGNAVASVCVENYGAIPAMPSMEQVQDKLKEERQA